MTLKPCPFCGGEAEEICLEDEANFGGSVIQCKACQASSAVMFDRKENLYDWWNRRAANEVVMAAIKASGYPTTPRGREENHES